MYASNRFIDVINTTKKWLTRQIRLIYSSTCVHVSVPREAGVAVNTVAIEGGHS